MIGTARATPDTVEPGHSRSATFRFVDLFADIGGIRAGLSFAGGSCEYSVEMDPYAVRTYELNWGPTDARDVRDVSPEDLPPHEILAAGFPCQPFSLAGVNKKASMGRAHGSRIRRQAICSSRSSGSSMVHGSLPRRCSRGSHLTRGR